VEMAEVRTAAAEIGEPVVHGRALSALAEVALFQRADAVEARRLAEAALEVLGGESPEAQYEALWMRSQVAGWLGDSDDFHRWAKRALEATRVAERKDLEALVTQMLALSYLGRLELDEAEPLVERALELAEESGTVVGRGAAASTLGRLEAARGRYAEAEASFCRASELYAETGNTSREASVNISLAKLLVLRGESERAEKLLR